MFITSVKRSRVCVSNFLCLAEVLRYRELHGVPGGCRVESNCGQGVRRSDARVSAADSGHLLQGGWIVLDAQARRR